MNARLTIGNKSMTIEEAESLLVFLKANPAETFNGVLIDVEFMASYIKECREVLKDFAIN